MKILSLILYSCSIIYFFVSCSEDQTVTPPTFTGTLANYPDIQAKVFSSCASNNCHSTESKKGNLDLTESAAYSNLYNRISVLYPQFKRVNPGKPAESVLMLVLRGELLPQMPINGSIPYATLDSIESWIKKGALRN